jgi:hypothetical protein
MGGYIREKTYNDCFILKSVATSGRGPTATVFFWKIIGGYINRESIYSDCFIGKISLATSGRGGAANII